MLTNADSGMTKERYLNMCEQLNKAPSEKECPPDLMEDFPQIVLDAFEVFNRLGDRAYPDIGLVGKDYTNLEMYLKLYEISPRDKDFFLSLLSYLEDRAVRKSAEHIKKEHEKLKRKHNGKK